MYEVEYDVEDMEKCVLCLRWIDDRYCIVIDDGVRYALDYRCLTKLKYLGILNGGSPKETRTPKRIPR